MVKHFTFFILLGLSFFSHQVEETPIAKQMSRQIDVYQYNRLCGPNSLFIIYCLLGVQANRDELARLAETNKTGTTLYGLKKAAEKNGLYAVGIKTTVSRLRQFHTPVIAHVGRNHFLVVAGFDGDRVKIVNPPQEPFTLSLADFKRIWTGRALIVSTKETDIHIETSTKPYFLLSALIFMALCGIVLWGVVRLRRRKKFIF